MTRPLPNGLQRLPAPYAQERRCIHGVLTAGRRVRLYHVPKEKR